MSTAISIHDKNIKLIYQEYAVTDSVDGNSGLCLHRSLDAIERTRGGTWTLGAASSIFDKTCRKGHMNLECGKFNH